ncbi:MAG: HD domain-containing protein [Opitutales bacterium]
MTNIKELKTLSRGEIFELVAVLNQVQTRAAKNGSEFMIADFSDKSGQISFMAFPDNSIYSSIRASKVGQAYTLRGRADFYNEKPSPRLEELVKIRDEDLNYFKSQLCPTSEKDPIKMRQDLEALIESITEEALQKTVRLALEEAGDNFYTSTAAKSMHHAFVHGLLEHTLSTAQLADKLFENYPFIDRNICLAGIICHDIGKVEEYTQGMSFGKTRSGMLQGHIISSYKMVRKAGIMAKLDADTLERLEHIILSHHGMIEWGALVLPSTPEAVFVASMDHLDAKMQSLKEALEKSTGEFSDPVFALEKVRLLLPKREQQTENK